MVLTEETFEITILIAVILAGLARTLIPYLAKKQDDTAAGLDPRDFSLSYVITAVISAIPVLVGSLLLLPTILPIVQNTGSNLMIFITAFGLAYTVNDVVNRSISTNLMRPAGTTTTTTTTAATSS